MRLLIISHKEIWQDLEDNSKFVTTGGFPFQIHALTTLFKETRLIAALRKGRPPLQARRLTGVNLQILPFPEPPGGRYIRKLSLLPWLMRHGGPILKLLQWADVVHTPIPGDLGTVGLGMAVALRKRLFVRHCGTWGDRSTLVSRILSLSLPRLAGPRVVVLATGGGEDPPCPRNPRIRWIFATTLTGEEMEVLPQGKVWEGRETLRLITVGRLDKSKNVDASIRALVPILEKGIDVHLDVVGDGPERQILARLASKLNLTERVRFHGYLDHIAVLKLLATCHIFLFPTKTREGFPKALLEALACGVPAIATRVSVIPKLLEKGAGIVIEKSDAEAISSAIIQIYKNPQILFEMKRNARQVAKDYTLEKWTHIIRTTLETEWGKLR